MDTAAFVISQATNSDIPKLVQLVNNAYRGEQAKKGWTHEADLIDGALRIDDMAMENLLLNPCAAIFKCNLHSSELAGCVYLEIQGNKTYLGMLSVPAVLQGKGIGKALLEAGESFARQNRCSLVEMTVISVRHELIAWYKKRGYVDTGMTKPFREHKRFGIPKVPVEFIVMHKELKY